MNTVQADDFQRARAEGTQADERNKAKDALETKPPLALAVPNWQNTEGRDVTLAELKGSSPVSSASAESLLRIPVIPV